MKIYVIAAIGLLVFAATLRGVGWDPVVSSQAGEMHDEIRAEVKVQIAPLKVSACTICLNQCWDYCPTQINPPEGCQEWCERNPCSGVC